MPKEGPPSADFDLKFLEGIAKTAAHMWPDLAPFGGPRWTGEDLNWAISFLYDEVGTERFARAAAKSKSLARRRNYLLKALKNRLLKRAKRLQGIELLDGLALDALPARAGAGGRLYPMDLATFVERAFTALSPAERATAAAYFEGDGAATEGDEAQARAGRRHRARLRGVVQKVVREEGHDRDEAREFIIALAAKLTGGAVRRKNPRICVRNRGSRGLLVVEARSGA